MRWRLYDPAPERLKELSADRRQEIVGAVRRGEQVDPGDADIAVEAGEWMVDQLHTTYLRLLGAPLSIAALLVLAMIGYAQFGDVRGSLINMVPYLAFLLVVRLIGRVLFRNAPEGLRRNRELLDRADRGT